MRGAGSKALVVVEALPLVGAKDENEAAKAATIILAGRIAVAALGWEVVAIIGVVSLYPLPTADEHPGDPDLCIGCWKYH
jgi:hypothetical protein